jgi:hypothetical protein
MSAKYHAGRSVGITDWPKGRLNTMTTLSFESALRQVAAQDVEGLIVARELYGDSWKAEGGFSAWFNIKRKIDRLVNCMKREPLILNRERSDLPTLTRERYDIFSNILMDIAQGGEASLDAVRDLRRYLTLVEAELLLQGQSLPLQRDNKTAEERRQKEHTASERPEGVADVFNRGRTPPLERDLLIKDGGENQGGPRRYQVPC